MSGAASHGIQKELQHEMGHTTVKHIQFKHTGQLLLSESRQQVGLFLYLVLEQGHRKEKKLNGVH